MPRNRDEELQEYLSRSGVRWARPDAAARRAAEDAWRRLYGQAFRTRPRLRQGAKADHAFGQEPCVYYLIVPFSAGVAGLPVHVLGRRLEGYECRGPLVPLGGFGDVEFFVCPIDFTWSMVHTHEDHALGGPYFIGAEWLPGGGTNGRTADEPSARGRIRAAWLSWPSPHGPGRGR